LRIFGPKRGSGRRLERNNEELHNLYSSPSIIRMIMSRRMRWSGYAVLMRRRRRVLVGKQKGEETTRKTKT
jgi:hypothetical protein